MAKKLKLPSIDCPHMKKKIVSGYHYQTDHFSMWLCEKCDLQLKKQFMLRLW